MTKEVTRADLMDIDAYGAIRKESRKKLVAMKQNRRVALGPYATAHFENYETMWAQIHEMLFIEKGGEEQIDDELEAYNPLIPQGSELVMTLFFEIDNPEKRKNFLSNMGGVEETCFISINGDKIVGEAEEDVDRTTADGKASSVQFIHFKMSQAQIAAFQSEGAEVFVGIDHDAYPHQSRLSAGHIEALSADFD